MCGLEYCGLEALEDGRADEVLEAWVFLFWRGLADDVRTFVDAVGAEDFPRSFDEFP